MKFPIHKIDGNKIITKDKVTSFMFELKLPDLEQYGEYELSTFIEGISGSLNSLNSEAWYKIYYLNGKVYLNTTEPNPLLKGLRFVSSKDPFKDLFEVDDFYSKISFKEDHLNFNCKNWRFIRLAEFPNSKISICSLMRYGDFVIHFKKQANDKAKKTLDIKRKLHQANLVGEIRNLESEKGHIESEDLLDSLISGDEGLFSTEVWILVKDESLEDLNLKTRDVIEQLLLEDAKVEIENVALDDVFCRFLCGVNPSFKRSIPTPTSYLARLLPLTDDNLYSSGYTFSGRTGKRIKFQIFNEESLNFNLLITGTSGSGKSFLAQKITKEEIDKGHKAVILDLGHSFDKLAKYENGVVLSQSFNPMQFKDANYLKEFILSIVQESDFGLKNQGLLLKRINEILSVNYDISFRDLILNLTQDFDGIDLYFEGLWDYLTGDLFEPQQLTYVDTTLYPERLKAPLIIFLIEYFKSLEGRKIFVFDECWDLLANHALYLEECFRTFRKHDAGAIAISQNLNDFKQSNLGAVITGLCFYKLIFQQMLDEHSFLDNYDVSLIKSLRSQKNVYSEVFLKTDYNRKVLRYYATDLEYLLFNTEPKEKKKLEHYKREFAYLDSFKEICHQIVGGRDV